MSNAALEIVVVNDHQFVKGGADAVALASVRGLEALGVKTTLFTAVRAPENTAPPSPQGGEVCLDQQDVLSDPNRLRAIRQGLWNGPAHAALSRLLAGKDPARTVVHVHCYSKALSHSVFRAAASLGFKIVLTLHDYFISCPNGGFIDHPARAICTRRPLSFACVSCQCDARGYAHKLWRVTRNTLQNRVLHVPETVTAYVSPTAFTANILAPYLPPEKPLHVVRYPVDLAPRPPADYDPAGPLVFAGRLVPEKGALLLAEAAQRLKVPVVFVGSGELRDEIARLCPHAELTGWLPPEGVAAQIRRARAFVFPSYWLETNGLTPVEAMAHGIPVLTSHTNASTDYIRDGETGLFFQTSNLDDLCAKIERLRAEPALAARLGRAAYDWYWADPWTLDRHCTQLLKIYQGLLPAASATHPLPAAA